MKRIHVLFGEIKTKQKSWSHHLERQLMVPRGWRWREVGLQVSFTGGINSDIRWCGRMAMVYNDALSMSKATRVDACFTTKKRQMFEAVNLLNALIRSWHKVYIHYNIALSSVNVYNYNVSIKNKVKSKTRHTIYSLPRRPPPSASPLPTA